MGSVRGGNMVVAARGRLYKVEFIRRKKKGDLRPFPDEKPEKRGSRNI